jgi:uncharacterized protein
MLGFSVTKLLVLAAVIVAVWYGFKLVGRLDAARKAEAKLRERAAEDARPTTRKGDSAPSAREPEAEEMVQCPACRAYVPAAKPKNCGRADCPY